MKRFGLPIISVLLSAFLIGCAAANQSAETTGAPAEETVAPAEEASGETHSETNSEEDNTLSKQNPIVTIEMENGGVIKAELYYDVAPNTVKNFIALANDGFYDGVIFHRVIPGFMIQGGDPTGTGMGGPDYCIKGEFSNNNFKNDLSHKRGVLSMARKGSQFDPASAYNTAGSQFFIMHADYFGLDGDYAAFGAVTDGMDVVDAIATTPRGNQDKPKQDQVIKSIRVETFGVDYGEPEKIVG